jgi:putative oxidoreductase
MSVIPHHDDEILTPATTQAEHVEAIAGRWLFAAPFAAFGLMHVAMASTLAGAVPAWVPGGGMLWVVLTGIFMLAAAISIATNKLTRLSGPLLALLMITYIGALHLPALIAGNQMEMGNILKNLALAGGALFIAARRT